jgi:iron transport multicopper oxidase
VDPPLRNNRYHQSLDATPGVRPPPPDSILVNGLGRFSGGESPLAVISVEYGKRYRFRLIAMSCLPNYQFSIDKHELLIIEADGNSVKPIVVDSLQILPGQRYSFVLHANQKIDNYWMRTPSNLGPEGFDGGVNSAILRYVGAPETEPTTPLTESKLPLLETNLHALDNPGAPGKPEVGGVDVAVSLNISITPDNTRFLVNGVSYDPPTIPLLMQILNGARTAQDLIPMGSVYPLARNKVVEVTFTGPGLVAGPVSSSQYHNLDGC